MSREKPSLEEQVETLYQIQWEQAHWLTAQQLLLNALLRFATPESKAAAILEYLQAQEPADEEFEESEAQRWLHSWMKIFATVAGAPGGFPVPAPGWKPTVIAGGKAGGVDPPEGRRSRRLESPEDPDRD
jgi:hypothetical protein